jgi:hypothetical protein
MSKVNVHDRLTVERIYPPDAFDRDSRMNAVVKTEIVHGIRITSPPDANGTFSLARTSHHVAEQDPEGDAVFVFSYQYQSDDTLMQGPDYGGPEEKSDASRRSEDGRAAYDVFISRVIEVARSANFKSAIGFHESRLEGFRGG